MGLTETISGDLTPTTESNNLDVHMEKNIEYGAMAILSASSYGNPNKIASGETTTGNKTGIVINLNKEWVAAGNLSVVANFTNANAKYKEFFNIASDNRGTIEITYISKKGDAISETAGWHGSTSSQWLFGEGNVWSYKVAGERAGLLRSVSGSIFSYYGKCSKENEYVPLTGSAYTLEYYSRAAMVCGEGI